MLAAHLVNVDFDVDSFAWVDTDSVTTLREAVELSNANPDSDTITFDPAVFKPSTPKIIDLAFGELEITEAVDIIGPGVDVLTVRQMTSGHQVFNVDLNGQDFALKSMTITGGQGVLMGGGVFIDAENRSSS